MHSSQCSMSSGTSSVFLRKYLVFNTSPLNNAWIICLSHIYHTSQQLSSISILFSRQSEHSCNFHLFLKCSVYRLWPIPHCRTWNLIVSLVFSTAVIGRISDLMITIPSGKFSGLEWLPSYHYVNIA